MKNILGKNESLKLFNEQGKIVYEYYIDSDGYWYECTYDKNGSVLTYKNSRGSWYEYTCGGSKLNNKNLNGTKKGFDIPEYTMEELVQKLGNFKLVKKNMV